MWMCTHTCTFLWERVHSSPSLSEAPALFLHTPPTAGNPEGSRSTLLPPHGSRLCSCRGCFSSVSAPAPTPQGDLGMHRSGHLPPLLRRRCGSHLTQSEAGVLQGQRGASQPGPAPPRSPSSTLPVLTVLRALCLHCFSPRYHTAPHPPSLGASSRSPQSPHLGAAPLTPLPALLLSFIALCTF